MATYTDTFGYSKGSATSPGAHKGLNHVRCEQVVMDFAAITTARVTASATALGAGDILQALHVPANTMVFSAGLVVLTVEGATQTFDLGDGSDADGWLDGVNGNALGGYAPTFILAEATPNTQVGFFGSGKHYTAADTIDLVQVNACDTAKVLVWALMANVNADGIVDV